MPSDNGFGALVERERLRCGMSARELARRLGVSVVYLRDVERGLRGPFSAERTRRVAAELGVAPGPLEHLARIHRYRAMPAEDLAAALVAQVGAARARGLVERAAKAVEP